MQEFVSLAKTRCKTQMGNIDWMVDVINGAGDRALVSMMEAKEKLAFVTRVDFLVGENAEDAPPAAVDQDLLLADTAWKVAMNVGKQFFLSLMTTPPPPKHTP